MQQTLTRLSLLLLQALVLLAALLPYAQAAAKGLQKVPYSSVDSTPAYKWWADQVESPGQYAAAFSDLTTKQQAYIHKLLTIDVATSWMASAMLHWCCCDRLSDPSTTRDARDICTSPDNYPPSMARMTALAAGHLAPPLCQFKNITMFVEVTRTQHEAAQYLGDMWESLHGNNTWTLPAMLSVLRHRNEYGNLFRDPTDDRPWDDKAGDFILALSLTGFLNGTGGAKWGIGVAENNAVEWAVAESVAASALEEFHARETAPPHMAHCRDINAWFRRHNWSHTELGYACKAQIAKPWVYNRVFGALGPISDKASRYLKPVSQWFASWSPVVNHVLSLVFLALWWFVKWSPLLAILGYLCRRPDVFVLWKSLDLGWPPSFSAYKRQVKLQHALAKARQSSSSHRAGTSSNDSVYRGGVGGRGQLTLRHSINRNAAASTGVLPTKPAAVSWRSWMSHLVSHYWLPRAHFAASSYRQLFGAAV